MIRQPFQPSCPIALADYPRVTLAHGGGGSLTNELVDSVFAAVFADPLLDERHDGARLPPSANGFAFSADSHVVRPLFFPGGDIGKLAVCGTVNDVAMCGARPEYLSASFILEEGLPMETLWRVTLSMKAAADEADVRVVTGDTKVVERGKGDGLYLNTSGVGSLLSRTPVGPGAIQAGDAILLSGDLGRHGVAVMAAREGLDFQTSLTSDCASLNKMTEALFEAALPVHCLRDLTRGGLATALVELAHASRSTLEIEEAAVPVPAEVAGACELLGLDPLFVANEGCCLAILPEKDAAHALRVMNGFPCGSGARKIGIVRQATRAPCALLRTTLGTSRLLSLFSGEQLPRIC